jgi:hypothetical protein
MTSFIQFCKRAKMRHDFSDQIQVRYTHPNGEEFDTWISGEEVMRRLSTSNREQLIRSFRRMNWQDIQDETKNMIGEGKEQASREVKDRLADAVSDALGDNIFGDTVADKIRGEDEDTDPYEQEKRQWQGRLHEEAFRMIALELAWINLEGTLPEEEKAEPDDWV